MPRPRTQDHIVRDRRVAMHLNILQKPLYTDIYRKNATPQGEPRTQTATLCEPAQSKRISTCHKSGFIQKFTGKMPRPRMSPERGHTLRASLRGQNACHHVTRATLYRNFHVKCRGPDWAQNAGTHFVRACAIEMHFNMSQEPLYTEIEWKNAAPENEPRTQTHTLCEPAQSKCTSTFGKSHSIRKFTRKMLRPSWSTLIRHQPLQLL